MWDYDLQQQEEADFYDDESYDYNNPSPLSPITSPQMSRRSSSSSSSTTESNLLSSSDFYPIMASTPSSSRRMTTPRPSFDTGGGVQHHQLDPALYNTLACLRLMKGELDVWHAIILLNKHREPIIQDFLCNELKASRDSELEFFLPQLCNLLLHTTSLPLERFMLDFCRRSVHVALRVYFFMKSALEDDLPTTRRKARYISKRTLHIVGPSANKVVRSFWDDELALANALTRLASSLFDVPKDKQNAVLKASLHQINCRLPVGLYLPITKLSDTYYYIINLVAEDAFCLGTKARVPYMMFAETVRVSGVMFSTMEGKLKEIQTQNQMALRPIPTQPRNNQIPQTPAFLAVMHMLKEVNDTAVTSLLHQALHLSGEHKPRAPAGARSPTTPAPSSSSLSVVEPRRSMSGIVARHGVKRKPRRTPAGNGILLRMDDDDEEDDDDESEVEAEVDDGGDPAQGKATKKKKAPSPHLRTLAEGGKQLLKLLSSANLKADKAAGSHSRSDAAIVERRRRIRPKHTAISLAYRELWQSKKKRIQEHSSFGSMPGWGLVAVIVKSEDDLRQEQLAMQLIKCAANIFELKHLPLYLRPYEITAVSSSAGMIEVIPDAVSVDSIKRRFFPSSPSLLSYFTTTYGRPGSRSFDAARNNFVESLAGYSLLCYLLQIRDRHNGNILLDVEGHIIHIDYGFLLGIAPGWWQFETAPFKLTGEYIELIGGFDSECYRYYEALFIKGFLQLRKYHSRFTQLIEMMVEGNRMPCLSDTTLPQLEERFKLTMSKEEVAAYVKSLIREAHGSWTTASYDEYQRWTNGILY